jgi:hypothetical protein
MARVAIEDKDPAVRRAVVYKLTDQALLARIARHATRRLALIRSNTK